MVRNEKVRCPHCHEETRIPKVLLMVIPPEGLKCHHCGGVVVYGNQAVWKVTEPIIWKHEGPHKTPMWKC